MKLCKLSTFTFCKSSLVETLLCVLTKLLFLLSFDGRVVTKLPFVPISWFQNLSHRNLPGSDYTDCSFIFLYILCTMSIRQVSIATLYDKDSVVFFLQCHVTDELYIYSISYFLLTEYSEASWFCSIKSSKQGTWFPHPSTRNKVNFYCSFLHY